MRWNDRVKANSSDFKIGLFVVGALGLLIGAIILFGATKLFQRRSLAETYVSGNVEGLKVGAPVLLRGVPVGEVTKIGFTWNVYHRPTPRYVLVDFDIRREVSLVPPGPEFNRHMEDEVQHGLRARVKSQGVIGASVVSLEYLDPHKYPPLAVPWKPRHFYIPAAPGQFSEILASLDKTMARVQQIDVEAITGAIQRDLDAADRLLTHLDQANFRQVVTNANALLVDVRETSARARSFIGPSNAVPKANLADLSGQARDAVADLKTSLAALNRVLGSLDEAAIHQTVENAERATRELDDVLHKLKNYPAGVLFGQPPLPARSVEPFPR